MFIEILQQIRWIDIFLILILGRIIFIGIKKGFITEAFKLLGLLVSIFVTFHYFGTLAKFVSDRTSFVSDSTAKVFFFLLLLTIVLLVFKLVREGSMVVIKMEAHPILDKWGGLIVSVVRGLLICSLVLVFFQVWDLEILNKHVKKSLLSSYVNDLSPGFYETCFNGFISKFFPNEKLNLSVFKLKN